MPSSMFKLSTRAPGTDLIASSICAAIRNGLFSQVRYLLELGHSPSSAESDTHGRSPLSLCSFIDDERWALSLAHLLLEKGASVSQCDKSGLNALHYACIYARDALLPVLLGASDFNLNVGDRHGNCALFYAANTGSLPLLKLMINALKRFDLTLDRPNRLGVTPLMQAWRANHLEAGNLLLKEGADPMRVDSTGRSCRSYEADARATNERQQSDVEARRLMLTLRIDDSAGWRKWRSLRSRSAPNGVRQSWHDVLREQRLEECVTHRQDTEIIRTASSLDARNDPQRVFDTDPADFFDRRFRSHKDSVKQRPRTAHHNRRRAPTPNILTSTSQPNLNGNAQDSPNSARNSWRGEVFKLYQQYECQCSASYRDTARPPSPSLSVVTNANGLDGQQGKEMLGLSVDYVHEMSSAHSRSRRGSALSQRSITSRDGSRKLGRNRKGSASRQSMESVLEDEDLQMLSQAGSLQRTRKRTSIEPGSRNMPRAISRPLKQPE